MPTYRACTAHRPIAIPPLVSITNLNSMRSLYLHFACSVLTRARRDTLSVSHCTHTCAQRTSTCVNALALRAAHPLHSSRPPISTRSLSALCVQRVHTSTTLSVSLTAHTRARSTHRPRSRVHCLSTRLDHDHQLNLNSISICTSRAACSHELRSTPRSTCVNTRALRTAHSLHSSRSIGPQSQLAQSLSSRARARH